MGIVVSEIMLLGMMLGIIIPCFGLLMFFLMIKKQAPEALLFMKARRKKVPVVMVHYPEGTVQPYIPKMQMDKDAEVPAIHYVVGNVGIKFRNPDGSKTERWMGEVPMFHYFRNIPEAVATTEAIAYSQLKDYFKEKGVDISGIEDVAFYVLSEVERSGNVKKALHNAQIDNQETMKQVLQFLNFVKANKKEIQDLKLKSGIFTYQTAVRALDSVIAYTSSNVAHMKSVIEASLRHEMNSGVSDMIKYGIFLFLASLGAGVFIMLARGD